MTELCGRFVVLDLAVCLARKRPHAWHTRLDFVDKVGQK